MKNDQLSVFLNELTERPDFASTTSPSVMMRSATDNTPLHIAALRGDTGMVAALLAAGADANAVGERGHTPLHAALVQSNRQVARMLVAAGSALDAMTSDGIAARDMANAMGLWDAES